MGKRYVMFVKEKIINTRKTPLLFGIILPYEYLKVNYNEQLINRIENTEEFLKNLDFKIIIGKSRNSEPSMQYELSIKGLILDFSEYLNNEDNSTGQIMFEEKDNIKDSLKIQKFFDIYHECKDLKIIDNPFINNINSFIICNKKEYEYAFKICDLVDEYYRKYIKENYVYVEDMLNNELINNRVLNYKGYIKKERMTDINILLSQIDNLKDEIKDNNRNIKNSKIIIDNLKEEIEKLKKQIKINKESIDYFNRDNINIQEYSHI